MWIVQCILETGSTDPEVIRNALAATTSFKGLLGEMSIDPATHNPQREMAIFEIRGSENVLTQMFR
jgi:branched-chain amino acid transport system substrate-binding protein